ncbi:MAG: PIG-L family deacetylase [Bacteroidales bacterium]
MKNIIILLALFLFSTSLFSQNEPLQIVVIGAHPDDADVTTGGTAIQFARLGHNVLFVSVTNGDAGHFSNGGGALAKIRRSEAEEAGKRFGVTYLVLDNHDGELTPDLNIRLDIIRLIREWNADVVIGPRPYDYHPDHRNTAILIQDAAFMVIVPNIAPDTPPLEKNPVFLFNQDRFQKPNPFTPDISVDISDVYKQKTYAVAAHESQFFEWLPWLAGNLEQVPEEEEERLEWLGAQRKREITPEIRKSLAKWYGEEKSKRVTDAESFEICEYGRIPGDEEIRRLFPMLGN